MGNSLDVSIRSKNGGHLHRAGFTFPRQQSKVLKSFFFRFRVPIRSLKGTNSFTCYILKRFNEDSSNNALIQHSNVRTTRALLAE